MTEAPADISPSSATPWPSLTRAWWVMAVFFVAAILYYTDRFILNLLIDPIRADLHISDTQISLLQGLAFALVYAFAGLPFGRLADVLPRKAVIITGVGHRRLPHRHVDRQRHGHCGRRRASSSG